LYRRAKAVLPAEELLTPIGQAAVRMKGEDLTIVTYGPLLSFCLETAEALRAEGASAEVIDLRTLRPLDLETVARSIQRTGRVLSCRRRSSRSSLTRSTGTSRTPTSAFSPRPSRRSRGTRWRSCFAPKP